MIEDLKKFIRKESERLKREIRIMEVCGTHTVAIFRAGIRSILPENIKLLSGPGCPVCVTPEKDVDNVIELSKDMRNIILTFGDMMRVPGTRYSLYNARSEGGDIRVIYSPMEIIEICKKNPDRKVIFFSVGFETTSPLIAGILSIADEERIKNLFIYPSNKLVPPAIYALLKSGEVRIDGFILPGHVSTIIGSMDYKFIEEEFGIPSVISGFEPQDILESIAMLVRDISESKPHLRIQYTRAVRPEGNTKALSILYSYFKPVDSLWRGIGLIPLSGLTLKERFNYRIITFTTGKKGDYGGGDIKKGCRCGDVLRGIITPNECPLFRKICTPETPHGACMVSTEGSCSAYYKYSSL